MHSSTSPRFISLNRLAQLSGRSRVTLLLRLKDGDLLPDALLDVGGKTLPLFCPDKAAKVRRPPARQKPAPTLNPML